MRTRSEQVIDYNVFLNGTDYLGVSTADLPEIAYLTNTLKGGGIAGELEGISPGLTQAMTLTLNWRTAEKNAIKLAAPIVHTLDLRGSFQEFDVAANEYVERGIKVTVRGRPLTLALGGLETAATMDASNTFSLTYLKVDIDGGTVLEIDKLNYIFKVNGVDYLARTRANLGY